MPVFPAERRAIFFLRSGASAGEEYQRLFSTKIFFLCITGLIWLYSSFAQEAFAGGLRMDARKPLLCAVAILVVGAQYSFNAYADPVTYSGDFNLRIPANPGDTKGWMDDAVIEIPHHSIIHDIDVGITLTHTNVFDLQIFLKSPAGKTICLNKYDFDQFFKGANYTQTIFDDEASVAIEQAQPPFTGRFRPIEPLYAFDGEDSFGFWRLRIYDAFYYDTGTLNKFELVVTSPEPATAVFLAVGVGLMTLLNHRRKQ